VERGGEEAVDALGKIAAIGEQQRRVKTVSQQPRQGLPRRLPHVVETVPGHFAQHRVRRVRNPVINVSSERITPSKMPATTPAASTPRVVSAAMAAARDSAVNPLHGLEFHQVPSSVNQDGGQRDRRQARQQRRQE
jgi:hypothetical protein